MKSKYPSWFCAAYPPPKPSPPPEFVDHYEKMEGITVHDDFHTDLKVPEGADSISLKFNRDYYDESVYSAELIFSKKTQIPNPKFAQLTKVYKQNLKRYEADYKNWKEVKKQWDIDEEAKKKKQEEQAEKQRKKLYLKLKKEFDQ